jgi:hypothetical protein
MLIVALLAKNETSTFGGLALGENRGVAEDTNVPRNTGPTEVSRYNGAGHAWPPDGAGSTNNWANVYCR